MISSKKNSAQTSKLEKSAKLLLTVNIQPTLEQMFYFHWWGYPKEPPRPLRDSLRSRIKVKFFFRSTEKNII